MNHNAKRGAAPALGPPPQHHHSLSRTLDGVPFPEEEEVTAENMSIPDFERHECEENDGTVGFKKTHERVCYIEDLTCNSMDFIGLPLPSNQTHGQYLQNVLGPTKGVKVAIVDSYHMSKALPNEYDSFNNLPIAHPIHGCKKETKLSSHGYLCASILAGKHRKADFYGLCDGTIRGVVPDVQLYFYIVGCVNCLKNPKMLAEAIDSAVKDEVRVISMSQGPGDLRFESFDEDWTIDVAKSSLEAFGKNILVCVPAGNEGSAAESIIYGMPWCVNVGACTVGKNLVTRVTIGTKRNVPRDVEIVKTVRVDDGFELKIIDTVEGISMNIAKSRFLRLRISKKLSKDSEGVLVASKNFISLIPVTENHRYYFYMLNIPKWPALTISRDNCRKIRELYDTIGELYLSISASRCEEDQRNTYVPEFSGRGPSRFYPEVIMPDFVAPARDILGSNSDHIRIATVMKIEGDSTEEQRIFNSQRMMTGTSLATPHVAGLFVALLSNRPQWTLSMAKSAAITTAWSFAENEIHGNEFAFGAGLMKLEKALDPVLVYDESYSNYKRYFERKLDVDDLNMASFAASFTQSHKICERSLRRELTNISDKNVTYKADIKFYHKGLDKTAIIQVLPNILSFKPGEKKRFTMRISLCPQPLGYLSALLIWKQSRTGHCVTSPIHLYHKSAFDKRVWYDKKDNQEDNTQVEEAKQEMDKTEKAKVEEKITGGDVKQKGISERTSGQKRPR